jgi:myo-inositol-1(or 4)-monophosphatase
LKDDELNFTIRLADSICKVINEISDKPESIDIIGITDDDVTRRVDKIAEDEAIRYIREEGVDALFISEESPPQKIGSNPKIAVILDPLDGSTNFVKKIPFSSVSVALSPINEEDKTLHIKVGVVKDIVRKEIYYAKKGVGAFFNGSKLRKWKEHIETKPLVNAYIDNRELTLSMENLQKYCNIRTLGSIALELCYLADSKFDGVVDVRGKLRLPDIAAGKLILEETGGLISDAYGRPLKLMVEERYSIVASISKSRLDWIISLLKSEI